MFTFKNDDLKRIEAVLGGRFLTENRCHRMVLENAEERRKLSFEIYSDIPIGKRKGNLISVYTAASHLQLHFCSGYVASDMLGEVTFVSQGDKKLSGLIIEKGAAMLGVGYRFGKWLPMVTWGRFQGNYIDPATPDEQAAALARPGSRRGS